MRIAFCFSGELRSIDKTWPILKNKLINYFSSYDIYYHTWSDDNDINKIHYIQNDPNTKDVLIEDRKTFHEKNYIEYITNNTKVQPFLRQLYSLNKCNMLKKEYEKRHDFKYDIVFRIRPDMLVCNDTFLEKNIEDWDMEKFVYTTDHDDYGGYNDKFYFSNSFNMDVLCSRIDMIDYYIKIGGLLHYEKFLKFIIDYSDLKVCRTRLLFTLLRTNGEFSGELYDNNFINI
jgi:hypothetical protein